MKGLTVTDLTRFIDERGFFAELMRNNGDLAQVSYSWSYPGVVRAWHRHKRGQIDRFIVLKGSMKVCSYDGMEISSVVVSEDRLQMVTVDGKYWHGVQVIGNQPALLIEIVNNQYDRADPDEERRPWNKPNPWAENTNK